MFAIGVDLGSVQAQDEASRLVKAQDHASLEQNACCSLDFEYGTTGHRNVKDHKREYGYTEMCQGCREVVIASAGNHLSCTEGPGYGLGSLIVPKTGIQS